MGPLGVCQMTTELRPAGAERSVYELATRLNKDRFDVQVDGRSPVVASSEGEKRLAILALYLSVKEFLEEATGEEPVLLMDEPFGILSESFVESLVNELSGQVILTAVSPAVGIEPRVTLQ